MKTLDMNGQMPQNAGKQLVRPTKQLCTAPTSATKLYMTKRRSLDAPIVAQNYFPRRQLS